MFKKILKRIIVGDPHARQKQFERMAKKEARRQREIDAGVEAFKFHRFGYKKLGGTDLDRYSKSDLAEIQKFKTQLMTPPKKKSFDSIISDFIPNPQNVGKVNMDFGLGVKKSRSSHLDDLARF